MRYRPSDDLLLALNMALHTGSPLLLTGEPGTGKTQAADFVSAYFAIPIFKFLVKSTSTAQDLMYEFDAVGYLHWAQSARRAADAERGGAEEAAGVRQGFLHKTGTLASLRDRRRRGGPDRRDRQGVARLSRTICCTNSTSTASRIPSTTSSGSRRPRGGGRW
jgi:DNA polymerase III delta prime subunit